MRTTTQFCEQFFKKFMNKIPNHFLQKEKKKKSQLEIRDALVKEEDPNLHSGPEQPRIQMRVLGHLLVRSFIRSHHSLIRLFRIARFTRALNRSVARSHTYSRGRGTVNGWMAIFVVFLFCPGPW